ncbi:hypothetical protein [Spirulina subsalsa]|uniref:hypothetical protein n=1 Tax=Spirulina subsalsa TaxID=54311 RepID=UPI00031D954C|nr:hypothetical protein [Spirulina subsalsa]
MSKYNVLVARLNQELTKIETAVKTATSQAKKATNTGDLDYLQTAALSLQNFYMGVEQAFEEEELNKDIKSFCQFLLQLNQSL